jgi:hypothetical protein
MSLLHARIFTKKDSLGTTISERVCGALITVECMKAGSVALQEKLETGSENEKIVAIGA